MIASDRRRGGVAEGEDEALLGAWRRDRDEAALGELVRRHFGAAHRLAARALGDAAAAEDAAADAFAQVLRDADRFDPARGPFQAWLRTIVLNRVRDAARGRERRARREARVAVPEGTAPQGEAAVERAEVAARLQALPDDLRLPLVLHYWEGLSHAQVGEALGCPTGTASSRIRRGLEQLRAALGAAAVAGVVAALERAAPAVAAPAAPAVATLQARAGALASEAAAAATTKLAAVALGAAALVAAALALSVALGSPDAPPATEPPGTRTPPATEAPPATEPAVVDAAPVASPVAAASAPAPAPAAPPDAAPPAVAPAPAPTLVVKVVDEAGRPVPGAEVQAGDLAAPRVLIWSPRPDYEHRARTGPDGEARFALPAGTELLLFAARGLDEGRLEGTVTAGPGARATLTLVPPTRPRPGTGAIIGRTTAAGGPVPAGTFFHACWKAPGSSGVDLYPFAAPRDHDGRYALRDLTPGTYVIELGPEGFAPARFTVEVKAGEVVTRDLDFAAESVLVGRVVGRGPWTSRDRGDDGFWLELNAVGPLQRREVPDVAADGTFRIGRLGPGRWRLEARLEGFAPQVVDVTIAGPGATELPPLRFDGGQGPVRGRLLEPGGRPAAGRRLAALFVSTRGEVVGIEATCDAAGRFALAGAPAGRQRLLVHEGQREALLTAQAVDVRPGLVLPDLVVAPRLDLDARLATRVTGRVLGPDGAPAAGALVRMPRRAGAPEVTTGADGTFVLDPVPVATSRTLVVARLGADLVAAPVFADLTQAAPAVELRLARRATLAGRVAGAPAGDQAWVHVEPDPPGPSLGLSATVGPDGAWEVKGGLPPGRYTVVVKTFTRLLLPGRPVELAPGAAGRLDLEVPARTGELVVEARGLPADGNGTQVRVRPAGTDVGATYLSEFLEDGGPTTLTGVAPGPQALELLVHRLGLARVRLELRLQAEATPPARVVFTWPGAAPGALEGRLDGLEEGRTVHVTGDAATATCDVAADGTFWLPELPPGSYRVTAAQRQAAALDPARGVPVEVRAGETTTVQAVPVASR